MEKKKKDNIKRFINNINKKLILEEILLSNGFFRVSGGCHYLPQKGLSLLNINF
jgi:hypothetical protein